MGRDTGRAARGKGNFLAGVTIMPNFAFEPLRTTPALKSKETMKLSISLLMAGLM